MEPTPVSVTPPAGQGSCQIPSWLIFDVRQKTEMITSAALRIYAQFDGDDDGWSRAGCPGCEHFGDRGWYEIRDLLQEVTCLCRNLVSPEYAKEIKTKIQKQTESPEAAAALMKLAEMQK